MSRRSTVSMISGMWGVGQIVGPALGGLLYTQYAPGFLGEHPQFLPSLVGAAISMVALVFVRAWLPAGGGSGGALCFRRRRRIARPINRLGLRGARLSRGTLRGGNDRKSLVNDDSAAVAAAEADAFDAAAAEATQASADAIPSGGDQATAGLSRRLGCCSLGVPLASLPPLLVYCLLSLVSIFFAESFPLWCMAPTASGGLGWVASQIGGILATSGFFLALSNFLLFPYLAKRIALTRIFKLASPPLILIYLLPPLLPAALGDGSPLLVLALMAQQATMQTMQSMLFTAVFMIINNSCRKAQRGRVNGLAMSTSSAFKAAGPTSSAMAFAWSLTNGAHSPPFDVHFTFLIAAGLGALTCGTACLFFTSANDTPVEKAAETRTAAVELATAPPAPTEDASAAEVEQGSASRSTRVPTSSPGPQKATRAAVYWKRY